MPGPHKGVSTHILINKHWQNPGINPQKETNRPETG